MDTLSPKNRSVLMGKVHGKNTKPEIIVRKWLHAHGYRFRLHRKDLPGHPDIVLPKYRTVIFVHGCFWHRHPGCRKATMPKTHVDFWKDKFETNVSRDARIEKELESSGWKVIVVWECEAYSMDFVKKLEKELRPPEARS